jgi:hypothetical protein
LGRVCSHIYYLQEQLDDEHLKIVLKTLSAVLRNIVTDPENHKFRQLFMVTDQGKPIQSMQILLHCPHSLQLLAACGFGVIVSGPRTGFRLAPEAFPSVDSMVRTFQDILILLTFPNPRQLPLPTKPVPDPVAVSPSSELAVGSRVQVMCTGTPRYGWGAVKRFDEGVLVKVSSGDMCEVDFEAQSGWTCLRDELRVLSSLRLIEIRHCSACPEMEGLYHVTERDGQNYEIFKHCDSTENLQLRFIDGQWLCSSNRATLKIPSVPSATGKAWFPVANESEPVAVCQFFPCPRTELRQPTQEMINQVRLVEVAINEFSSQPAYIRAKELRHKQSVQQVREEDDKIEKLFGDLDLSAKEKFPRLPSVVRHEAVLRAGASQTNRDARVHFQDLKLRFQEMGYADFVVARALMVTWPFDYDRALAYLQALDRNVAILNEDCELGGSGKQAMLVALLQTDNNLERARAILNDCLSTMLDKPPQLPQMATSFTDVHDALLASSGSALLDVSPFTGAHEALLPTDGMSSQYPRRVNTFALMLFHGKGEQISSWIQQAREWLRTSRLDQESKYPGRGRTGHTGLGCAAIVDACTSSFATKFNTSVQHLLCRDPSVYIHALCAQHNKKFLDVYFPPVLASLRAKHVKRDRDIDDEKFSWMRASDYYPQQVLFHPDASQLGDLGQGHVGNCWCVRCFFFWRD